MKQPDRKKRKAAPKKKLAVGSGGFKADSIGEEMLSKMDSNAVNLEDINRHLIALRILAGS